MRATPLLPICILLCGSPFVRAQTPVPTQTPVVLHLVPPAPVTPLNPAALTIEVLNAAGAKLASASDPAKASLTYGAAYQPGDSIVIAAPPQDKHLVLQVDANVPEAQVFTPTAQVNFAIPFDRLVIAYDPRAFTGASHLITARLATPAEIAAYRNVAVDSLDLRGQSQYFPHADANAVTRNDPQFFERNAIDGNTQNNHHGKWPYESWGNNKDPHPTLKIEFGRKVMVDKVRLYVRADFPHDSYWTHTTVTFPDGSSKEITLQKTAAPQDCTFPPKEVDWIELTDFKQPTAVLGWASITEVEVYGKDAATP